MGGGRGTETQALRDVWGLSFWESGEEGTEPPKAGGGVPL